jgi:hypothetical protein
MIRRVAFPGLILFAALALDAPAAFATGCTGPAANAGAQFYNSTFNVMQYCNGTYWINMGTTIGGIGMLTSPDLCTTDGTNVNCTTSVPLTGTYGGTGINNGSNTLTLGGSVTYSGAHAVTWTTTGTTTLTLPTSGTLETTTLASGDIWIGNASSVATATALPLSVANGGTGASTLASLISLTADVTGTLPVANGGTGASTLANLISLTADVTGALPVANGGTGASTLANLISLTADVSGTLPVANGGTGVSTLSNAFALGDLATIGSNTVLGNGTSITGNATALSVLSCSTSASAVTWTTNTGFGCNTSIAASTATSATSATTATTATNATNVATTGTSTSATFYPLFVAATSGNQAADLNSSYTFNPATGALNIIGALETQQTIGTTSTNGIFLTTSGTATSGTAGQQWSPRVHWEGQGYKTGTGSQAVDVIEELQTVQGSPTSGNLVWSSQVNGGGYGVLLTLPTGGGLNLNSGTYQIGGTQIACSNLSNGATGCSTTVAALATLGVGTGLTSSGGNLNLTTPVTVANGGTGVTAAQGNGTLLQLGTSTPSAVSGHCVQFDAHGNVQDSGAACGTTSGVTAVANGGTGLSTTTANDLLYSSSTGTIANLATANSSVLVTSSGGVPSLSTTLPAHTVTTSVTVPTVIGGTGASSSLTLQSTSGVGTSDSIAFKTGNNGGATAMTILDSGYVIVNGSSAISSGKFGVDFNGQATRGIEINETSGNANSSFFMMFYSSGSNIGNVQNNNNTAVTYNTASDRRLKENIADTTMGLGELMHIPVRDFNFTADASKTRVQGFVAQELYKIYPEAVAVGGDDPKKNPWGVDYGRLTPLIVKAVQELKAENDELAERKADAKEIEELRREVAELRREVHAQ